MIIARTAFLRTRLDIERFAARERLLKKQTNCVRLAFPLVFIDSLLAIPTGSWYCGTRAQIAKGTLG